MLGSKCTRELGRLFERFDGLTSLSLNFGTSLELGDIDPLMVGLKRLRYLFIENKTGTTKMDNKSEIAKRLRNAIGVQYE
jgi:hypothetical protein